MPNVYIDPNGGSPKVWARNEKGDVIYGSLSGRTRKQETTTVTESVKQRKGYVFIVSGSWKAIEAVLMGAVTSITVSDRNDAVSIADAIRGHYHNARLYDPPANAVPDPTTAAKPAPVPPPPAAPDPVAPMRPAPTPQTVQQSIKEWANSPSDSSESAWSW